MVKIFWRQGAEAILPGMGDEIRSLADAGIMVALARLDDESGLEIGHRLGINLFQALVIWAVMSGVGIQALSLRVCTR